MNVTKCVFNLTRHNLFKNRFAMRHLNCTVTGDNEYLQIIKENNTHYFPLVWLRDNCTCEKCYHGQSSSRILNWDSFNVDVKTRSVEVSSFQTPAGCCHYHFLYNHSLQTTAFQSFGRMVISPNTIIVG